MNTDEKRDCFVKIQEWRRLAFCSVGLLAAVLLVSLTGMLHPLAGNNLPGEENGTGTASERLQDIAHVEAHGRNENRSAVTQEPRRQYVVVIDAGHGGDDEGTGSTDWKYLEKDYALKVSDCLKEILDGTDIQAYYTRTDDREVSKEDRVRLAKKVGADALISIHCNASDPDETTAKGVETLYSSRKAAAKNGLSSKELARNMLECVCETTGRQKRKVIRRDRLYLMHHADMPVTIVEIGFMTNRSDMEYMKSEENQKAIAQGIYREICTSFHISE